jgi:beta-mannosidase
VSLANVNLVDPQISITPSANFTFTLSAKGGVGVWTWMDHPAGTVGIFVDTKSGMPSNGFFLIPGMDRTGTHTHPCDTRSSMTVNLFLVQFEMNPALSRVKDPKPEDFVVRSLWNNTHI